MTIAETIQFNIDFASDYRLSGWALNTLTNEFPKAIQLHAKNGTVCDLSIAKLISRQDVCTKFGLEEIALLGFEVNLLDAFNDRTHDYKLLFDGKLLWSYENYLASLEQTISKKTAPLKKQYGTQQVVVIYSEHAWLHEMLLQIHTWSPNYFDKDYQPGVSFIFLNIAEFGIYKDKLMRKSSNSIFVIEQAVYRSAVSLSDSVICTCPIILLNRKIDLSIDFNGLLSVICALTEHNTNDELTASNLIILLTSIAAYSSLLFDNTTGLYSYQSGTSEPWMQERMRQEVQAQAKEDIIILSNQPVARLSDIDPDYCAAFIRASAMRFLIDTLNNDLLTLLNTAFKRGARIRVHCGGVDA